jgi:5-methylcytosine-specific restriction enzyme subunit McrC
MLAYAFQVLNEEGYKEVATEQFDNVAELCAAILSKGVSLQLKCGLGREYISETETLSGIRGKINITESIKTQTMLRKQMVCTYDEFSVNTYMNRIIKTTMLKLLHTDIDKTRKKEMRKLLVFFDEVDVLDVHSINWNQQYYKNNQTYRMLISICYLVLKGLLQTTTDGSTKLMQFVDEQRMCHLYEKFILEYYRKEHPQITANASQIPWQLDDDFGDMLPVMQTDIMLSYREKVLVIDAKYYQHSTQTQYDKHTLHSGNLYQIFTYVKNKEAELQNKPHEVSGMLIYAKTDEEITPNQKYKMSGNKISVRTLDLNMEFDEIKKQLDEIVDEYFGKLSMSDILFEYKSTPAFGFYGMSGGESIVVYSDGSIVHRDFVFGQKEPSAEDKLAFIPEVAVFIEKVLFAHKEDFKKIPDKLNNGTLDGSHDCFQFGNKTISSWTIQRNDILKFEHRNHKYRNHKYYMQCKENMIHGNMVLDIYNEIIDILNEYNLGVNLTKK